MRPSRGRRPNVAALREEGDLAGLLAALDYQDVAIEPDGGAYDRGAPIRRAAVVALSDFYGPTVGDGLTTALSDRDPEVRAAAVEGLSHVGVASKELLSHVVTWEARPYADAIRKALEALGSSSQGEVPEALVERLITEPSIPLQDWHPHALEYLVEADPRGPEAWTRVADRVLELAEGTLDELSRDRAETVWGWLDPVKAESVAHALTAGRAHPFLVRLAGEPRDARTVEPLIRIMEASDSEARSAAAVALGKVRDTRAVPALLSATQDPSHRVRAAAGEALDSMGLAGVVIGLASLGRAQNHEDPDNARLLGDLTDRLSHVQDAAEGPPEATD